MRLTPARLVARSRLLVGSVRRVLGAAGQRAPGVVVQLVGLAGFAAFIEGVRQVHQPTALIVGGALAVAWAVLKSRSPA